MTKDDVARGDPAAVLRDNFGLIGRAVRHVAKRHCLGHDDLEDFEAEVHLKLIDNDYAVLRGFQGRSRLSTYLFAVIERAFLDYQIKRFGKWRPSAIAQHLGPLAVEVERLISCEGRSFEEVCTLLDGTAAGPVDREAMSQLLARLPARPRRRMVGPEGLVGLTAPDGAGIDVEAKEREETARRAGACLGEALARLAPQDRLILRLAFVDGLMISTIATILGLDQRRLYRRRERALGQMRSYMEAHGMAGPAVTDLIGDPAARIQAGNLTPARMETRPPGPSHNAGAGRPGPDGKRGRE